MAVKLAQALRPARIINPGTSAPRNGKIAMIGNRPFSENMLGSAGSGILDVSKFAGVALCEFVVG
jgi:hypothetical protein